jgi:hypothetical protein
MKPFSGLPGMGKDHAYRNRAAHPVGSGAGRLNPVAELGRRNLLRLGKAPLMPGAFTGIHG